jgi:hypothetical protein
VKIKRMHVLYIQVATYILWNAHCSSFSKLKEMENERSVMEHKIELIHSHSFLISPRKCSQTRLHTVLPNDVVTYVII